jgi:homoserine O-acetyltransferase
MRIRTQFAPRLLPVLAALFASQAMAAAPPQQFSQLGDLKLESGATIRDCALGYRTLGTLNPQRSNAVVFLPWHTGKSAEALGLLGPKGLFDPGKYYVVVVDAIGNGVSCSPSNSKSQRGPAFPAFTIRDMVASTHRLLTEKLALKHVHAMIGYSMGGSQTFQWMVSHPNYMNVAIPIAATPRQTSYDLLLWRTEEHAITMDPDYAAGNYTRNPVLSLYQQIFSLHSGTPGYRVAKTRPEGFEKFFKGTAQPDPDAPDANDMLWQIRAFLPQDIGAAAGSDGSLAAAAAKVRARVHIIVARNDQMVNPGPALEFAALAHATTTVIDGDCGHSALVCAADQIRPALERVLAPQGTTP